MIKYDGNATDTRTLSNGDNNYEGGDDNNGDDDAGDFAHLSECNLS